MSLSTSIRSESESDSEEVEGEDLEESREDGERTLSQESAGRWSPSDSLESLESGVEKGGEEVYNQVLLKVSDHLLPLRLF